MHNKLAHRFAAAHFRHTLHRRAMLKGAHDGPKHTGNGGAAAKHTHPSAFVSGRAWKPNGLSLRHALRSIARRPLATPSALIVRVAVRSLASPVRVLCVASPVLPSFSATL